MQITKCVIVIVNVSNSHFNSSVSLALLADATFTRSPRPRSQTCECSLWFYICKRVWTITAVLFYKSVSVHHMISHDWRQSGAFHSFFVVQEYTVTSTTKASVITLGLHKKCNSCKWGARVVAACPAKSPSHPCVCQQTTHSFLLYGWLCRNIFALWDARPFWWESEQTCPSSLWARSKAKAERCMTKGGETSKSEKVKKRRERSERADIKTARIQSVFVSSAPDTRYTCLQ